MATAATGVTMSDASFGVCPHCHKTDGYINVGIGDTIELGGFRFFTGAAHFFVCHEHQVQWRGGFNPLSTWRDETEAERERQATAHLKYRVVEAYYPSEEEACPPMLSRIWPASVSLN
jgi:hypothetical protein